MAYLYFLCSGVLVWIQRQGQLVAFHRLGWFRITLEFSFFLNNSLHCSCDCGLCCGVLLNKKIFVRGLELADISQHKCFLFLPPSYWSGFDCWVDHVVPYCCLRTLDHNGAPEQFASKAQSQKARAYLIMHGHVLKQTAASFTAQPIVPTVWFVACTVLSDWVGLLGGKVLDTESWLGDGICWTYRKRVSSIWQDTLNTASPTWTQNVDITSCKRPTELSCLFQNLYCIPTSSETNTK